VLRDAPSRLVIELTFRDHEGSLALRLEGAADTNNDGSSNGPEGSDPSGDGPGDPGDASDDEAAQTEPLPLPLGVVLVALVCSVLLVQRRRR
jgi:hypothetical protein